MFCLISSTSLRKAAFISSNTQNSTKVGGLVRKLTTARSIEKIYRQNRWFSPKFKSDTSLKQVGNFYDWNSLSSDSKQQVKSEEKPRSDHQKSNWRTNFRRHLVRFERFLLYGSILAIGTYAFCVYRNRFPPVQADFNPDKKTIVILGSGWSSASILKKIDTRYYNVICVSPRNYFLFTPLLPSTPTGAVEVRSIMEPIRQITRHKGTAVQVFEAECTSVNYKDKNIVIRPPNQDETIEIPYDYLVIGVGAESATFNIPGVSEHGCFLKEVPDVQKIRKKIMDCIERASIEEKSPIEKKRLLHTVVVGGGPTGIEFAAELRDFFVADLQKWYPEIKDDFKVTLIEALPSVLPSFNSKLIEYTESQFKKEHIDIHTKTMVKEVREKEIVAEATLPDGTKQVLTIPYGLLVWAAGNSPRQLVKDMISQIPEQKNARRGLFVNDYFVVNGTANVWALGDCTSTKYAPTAQVAAQQGYYLANLFNNMAKIQKLDSDVVNLRKILEKMPTANDRQKVETELEKFKSKIEALAKKMGTFHYSHQGNLAYIGSEKAIAEIDIPWINGSWASGGAITLLFWRSAYLSKIFSLRLRTLVMIDWLKAKLFGRDISRQ